MTTPPLKNVVVVGGSGSGGAALARALERSLPDDCRLVLIEKNQFAYWPIGGLRAAVKPDFEKQVFASFDGFFDKNSRHVVLAGYNVEELTENTVKLDKLAPPPFNSDTITLEAGVIATGTHYALPMRPMSSKRVDAEEGLRKMQGEVAKAQHILIVGGGPVGIEFAGEILQIHPGKKVTLVQQGENLMTGFRAPLGKKLLCQLKSRKVDVRLNCNVALAEVHMEKSQRLLSEPFKVTLSDGTEVDTDFLFIGTGGKPNTDLVPQEALDDAKPRRINVNASTLRLLDPTLGTKWFAMGDACNAPGAKTHVNANAQAPSLAAQVVGLVTGNKSTKVYKQGPNIMVVPIGESAGAAQLVYPVVGEWFTSMVKGKHLFVSSFLKTFTA